MDFIKKSLALTSLLILISCGGKKEITKETPSANEKKVERVNEAPKSPAVKEESLKPDLENLANSNPSGEDPNQNNTPKGTNNCQSIVNVTQDFESGNYKDAYVTGAKVDGESLMINMEYSGCQKGQVVLAILNPEGAAKGQSVKLQLKVTEAGMCEMLLEDYACFDLSSLGTPAQEYFLTINTTTIKVTKF